MAEKLSTRVDRLEESMQRAFTSIDALAEKEKKLDDVLVLLTEAQIRTEERFQETEKRFQETERRFQETEKKFQRTDERIAQIAAEDAARGRALDERIDKLVSAIGELIRARNGGNR